MLQVAHEDALTWHLHHAQPYEVSKRLIAAGQNKLLSLQDVSGVGQRGANLVFSTSLAGSPGSLQDWLTISSAGLDTFAGNNIHLFTVVSAC